MALVDITYNDGSAQNMISKLDPVVYSGSLSDELSCCKGYIYKLTLTAGGGSPNFAYGG